MYPAAIYVLAVRVSHTLRGCPECAPYTTRRTQSREERPSEILLYYYDIVGWKTRVSKKRVLTVRLHSVAVPSSRRRFYFQSITTYTYTKTNLFMTISFVSKMTSCVKVVRTTIYHVELIFSVTIA